MTIIFSYIFYFIASSASSLQLRWITKKRDLQSSEQILFTFQFIFILFLGSLFFPFFSPFYLHGGYHLVLLFLLCGTFGMGTNLLSTIAQKHVDAGVTSVISNIYTPVTIVLSSIFLQEGLSLMQIYGTILLLVALIIVSKKHRIGIFKFDRYFMTMLLSGILLGVLLVGERALQKTTGFSAGIMISWGSQAFFLGLVTLFTKSRHAYTNKEVAITGVVKFFGALSYVMLTWTVANLSLVASVTTFKIVILFITGAIFLGEREDMPRKIIGSVIAIVGLLLMK